MSQKRISRARKRDLEKPDEFLSVTATAIQTLNRYRTPLVIGIVVVFASLAVFSVVRFFGNRAETRAFERLSANLENYQAAVRGKTPPRQALEQVQSSFEDFLAEDARREGGRLGRLVYADLNYRAGLYDTAIAHYEKAIEALPQDHFARGNALSGLGYALMGAGQDEAAAECFQKLVDGSHPQLKADALFQLGRIYGKHGEAAKQTEVYQRLLEEAPAYIYADLIRQKIES
ncbi:MAG: tetratricopeptide repeat protein [Desulfobacterales bacterium]|nr:tetratricopeptide repeat protein [Desulfobacterales bacterium]MDJ0886778.1 tetratricopeptide repeat protein [Desulfobacterales bacterium]MDJ0990178.1 tetratricopeptide repeat protein [Desulfobacterales bacterium]